MDVGRWINTRTLTEHAAFTTALPLVATAAGVYAMLHAFVLAAPEQAMGPVQRIFYFHVASATSCYLMVGVLFVGSLFYLVTRIEEWDVVGHAAASVALLLCTIVLVTGMIWGHAAWNTWWRWEPRLVSSLALWLVLLSYWVLRVFAEGHPRERTLAAITGIIATVNVPIVIFSVKLLTEREQLHPQVIANQGLADPSYKTALSVAMIALCVISLWLFVVALVNRLLAHQLQKGL